MTRPTRVGAPRSRVPPGLLRSRYPALFERDFAIFLVAHVVSRVGTQMRDVALAWHIYLLTKSPLALGLLGAFRVVPVLALALAGGVAADALDRRRLLIVTQSVLTVAAAAMALLALSGEATPPLLYGLVAVSAAATAFDNPARQALVVNLLPDRHVPNGLALGIFGWQAATVVGPAIGGVLIAATSVGVIYAIDAVTFLAVIAALAVVRPRRAPAVEAPAAAARADRRADLSLRAALDALRFLRTKPILIWLMVVDFLATFFAGSLTLLPIFANEVFHAGERGLGLLAAAPAAGALLASAWMSSRRAVRRQGLAVLGAIAVYGASVAAFGLARWLWLGMALLAVSGAADTVSTVVRQIVRQTHTPDAMRGRMTAVNMMFFMGGPHLGEVEAGVVAQLTNARVSVASGGAACLLVALVVALFAPHVRKLESGEGKATA